MQYVLIAEHPRRARPIVTVEAYEPGRYAPLAAGTLSDAAGLSAAIEGKTPLLRIHLTDSRPVANALEMVLPPRAASIVSLIHDASLLAIADGAVITADEDDGRHRTIIECAAKTLAGLGYSISPGWCVQSDQVTPQKGVCK
ncbi:hypothetical protein HQO82_12740 [Rhodococcus fascians]|nr:hypothetical protein [Rhodococcus fascians]MBY4114690.1 hypothetical protein [Rhodococcus fascians]